MFFSSSKSVTNQTTNNIADSYNATLSKTDVTSESGNTTLNIMPPAVTTFDPTKWLPLAALLCFAVAAWLYMRK